jgi:hypothetical protein
MWGKTNLAQKSACRGRRGIALIISMIFLVIFSALAVSMATMASVNIQLADSQHKVNSSLSAAESGLECGRYLLSSYVPMVTYDGGDVTASQADQAWSALCSHVQTNIVGGAAVPAPIRFTDAFGSGDQLMTDPISFGAANTTFQIRFHRYDADPYTIKLQSVGTDGAISRRATIDIAVQKDSEILKYAVASKSRMIVTGDSTIDGDVYSTWNRPGIATPFELDDLSNVNGTVNTVISKNSFDPEHPDYVGYTLETLDEDGSPVFDEDGNRVHSPGDKVQGTHDGINYDQPQPTMTGFDYTDYDTSSYKDITTAIPASDTIVREYFPHRAGDYTQGQNWSSRRINRHVYENQTFSNQRLPTNRNALFKNCTFEEVLFIESATSGTRYVNNVRFEDCTFNGITVSDVPDDFRWQHNVLYYTGNAIFDNDYMEEATILAPNFNVNIGNTKELEEASESVLTGMVVGGIVDIRGNANVDGTILSMYDPTPLGNSAFQYGTNIGFSDENNEAGIPEDVGTIRIHSDPDRMLPAGVKSDIILVPNQESYTEY